MLNDLDRVDWEKLTSGSGSASEVPELIRGLCSDDPEQRTDAYVRLVDELWHQGNVYEASMYAIPFLVELLEAHFVPDKARIAALVGEIATGASPMHQVMGDGVDWDTVLAKRARSFESELATERFYSQEIRRLVKTALPTLVPYLEDAEPAVRRVIADVLSNYPELRDKSWPLLENALADEPDKDAQKDIQRAIDRLVAGT